MPWLTREHAVSLLIAFLCVVLAALALRATGGFPDHERVRGELGESVQLDDIWVTIDGLRAGSVAVRDDRDDEATAQTPGLFLVLDVEARAPGVEGGINRYLLHSGTDREYEPYETSAGSLKPEAGFAEYGTVYFEVDPNDLEDMVLEVWTGAIFTAYEEHLYIDLKIDAAKAAELQGTIGQDVGYSFTTETVAIP